MKIRQKKKILIIGNIFFRNKISGLSGNEVRLAEIVKNWDKLGYEIHLWSGLAGKELFDKYKIHFIFHRGYTLKTDNNKKTTYIFLIPKLVILPKSLWNFKGIVYTPTEAFTNVLPAVFLKLINKSKVKWGCVVHWLPPLLWWKRKHSSFFYSLAFLLMERAGLYLARIFADVLLPVSEGTARQLESIHISPTRFKTVCCGVDFKKAYNMTKNINKKKYEAIFIKRIQSPKGVFDLIDIWYTVVGRLKDAKLVVIGTGPDDKQFRQKIIKKKLVDNIELRGLVFNDEKKFSDLKKAKIFILPSYEENWAIVVGEAMTLRIPVIAYDLPELRLVWRDNFIRIPLGDTDLFAQKIIEILGDQQSIDFWARKGFDYVQKYDWHTIAKNEIRYILES